MRGVSNNIMESVTIFWFRRDLRLDDNHGLFQALSTGEPVLPLFIFDENILVDLSTQDHRVNFIYDSLQKLHDELEAHQSGLMVRRGDPVKLLQEIFETYQVISLVSNTDYEPYAIKRDEIIQGVCQKYGVAWSTYQDHLIFDPRSLVKSDGEPYRVYTAYKNNWMKLFFQQGVTHYPSENLQQHFYQSKFDLPTREQLKIDLSLRKVLPINVNQQMVQDYASCRDYPARLYGTTRLGPHLRFGTISIRSIAREVSSGNELTLLSELVWREFFTHLLVYFPHTVQHAYQEVYDAIPWRYDASEFLRWKEGMTGYPLVDAGMRELKETGYMHNRVRMVVASFLTKHLLIDWRLGEQYFAAELFDYELASNVGNWQWVAGIGVDAAPYFRIFNPSLQTKRFDRDFAYIKRWVPEVGTPDYPDPMIEHEYARARCLKAYAHARSLRTE